MMNELGYCSGVKTIPCRAAGGRTAANLVRYLPADGLLVVDESHVTIPQMSGILPRTTGRAKRRW